MEPLILLVVAVGLGGFALHELAPRQWASAVRGLRANLARPTEAPVNSTVTGHAVVETQSEAQEPAALGRYPWLLNLAAPAAIVALAFALRVVNLTGSPLGFFCDEASNALDAYWIGHTLHDQHGAYLPAFFYALSDWRGGFHIYWEVPFVLAFGPTEFAVRFGSAVAGTLTVWLTYLFVSKAVNRPVGLIAAFLLATSPWHLTQSRVGWEIISVPFATALCLTFLYLGLERPRWLPLAFVFGVLGMYTYQPGRVFFPLFCLAWAAIYTLPLWRLRPHALIGLAGAAVALIPTALSVQDGTFFARLNQLSGPMQTFSGKLAAFWISYQAHYSWNFLFEQTAGQWITRHFVRGFGVLYPVEAPFLVLGLIVLVVRHRRADLLFLIWLVVYPIGAALVDTPVATRAITGVIVLQIIVAQGVYTACLGAAWLVRRLTMPQVYRLGLVGAGAAILLVVGLAATGNFMNAYLNDYPRYSSGWDGWQWGPEQMVTYFVAHRRDYDRQFMNVNFNAPDEFIRYYTVAQVPLCTTCMNYDPTPLCNCTTADTANPADFSAKYVATQRQLWALPPADLSRSNLNTVPHRIVRSLLYPDGTTAFVFVATGPHVALSAPLRAKPGHRHVMASVGHPVLGQGLAAPGPGHTRSG